MNACRIAVLPPELADQIAAGEVVERPASVVKELVENALDAGARRIEVEVEQGGLSLIRVTDDGCGMTEEEARLSLLRHATSKLHTAEDLFALTTMGFRGEALPSIAAVSRLTLTTRTAGAVSAYRLQVEGGRLSGPGREAGAQVGTQVEVRDLLHNVPARLKFMKGEATETGHIAEAMIRLSLAYPEVHFKLKQGGRVTLDLPAHKNAHERSQAALQSRGKAAGPTTLYLSRGGEGEVEVEAYLGAPADASTTPRNVYLLVNQRFIRDRSLLHAAVMGYGELLSQGRYPLLVLHVRLPPAALDVNVHPQKLEVRFARAQEVYAAVRHTLHKTAVQAPWLLGTLSSAEPRSAARTYVMGEGGALPAAGEARPGYGPQRPQQAVGAGLSEHRARLQQALHLYPPAATGPAASQEAVQGLGRQFFSVMRYLGQLRRTYLTCEHEGDLILIDQHAAHERLAFERLRAAYGRREVRSQRLLFPLTLDFDPERAALLGEHAETLSALGFELRPFGGRSFALLAGPDAAEFGRGARTYQDPENLLRKVLDELQAHGESDAISSRAELVLATVACHSVVRAGDALDEARARALLQAMDEFEFCPHCPHGRPVLVRIPPTEVEKRFGRT